MAAKAQKLGPGQLTFGEVGSQVEFGVAVRECVIETSVDEGELVVVLSGDEIDDGETETYAIKGRLFQSYDRDSLLIWAHVNAGTVVEWSFVPVSESALAAKGSCKVRRINIGGTADQRNETEFTFPGRLGMYTLYDTDDVAQAPITVYPAPVPAP